jgi:hypothetical protein
MKTSGNINSANVSTYMTVGSSLSGLSFSTSTGWTNISGTTLTLFVAVSLPLSNYNGSPTGPNNFSSTGVTPGISSYNNWNGSGIISISNNSSFNFNGSGVWDPPVNGGIYMFVLH